MIIQRPFGLATTNQLPWRELKKQKVQSYLGTIVSFSDKDLEKVQLPHRNALVLNLGIGDFNVERVLINPSSSTEVTYMDCFKKLGLKEANLKPTTCLMIGFNGVPVWPTGVVSLPIIAGSVMEILMTQIFI